MQRKIFNPKKKNILFVHLLFLILISFVGLMPFFHLGLPRTHDGELHILRLASFYSTLSEGNIVPRWAANLNQGYGHPVLQFLYPLPMYIGSFFHILGFSFIDAAKLIFVLSFFLSGVFIYLWLKEVFNQKAALAAAVLYLFSPYRFVDLYVRGGLGENLAFVFPPLICFCLLKFKRKGRLFFWIASCLAFAGLILAHNALALTFTPFIVFYGLILGWKDRRLLFNFFLSLIMGLTLSVFFWFPAIAEGKYTLRRTLITSQEVASHLSTIEELIIPKWGFGDPRLSGGFSKQVGIINWLVVLTAILTFPLILKKRWKNVSLIGLTIMTFFISLLLILRISFPFWQRLTLLRDFYYPWRILSITTFASAILAGSFFYLLTEKKKFAGNILILIFVVVTVFLNKDYLKTQRFWQKSDKFFLQNYEGSTDQGESSSIWAPMTILEPRVENFGRIGGLVDTFEVKRTTTYHELQVNVKSDKALILDNTLYFPGWRLFIDGQDKTDTIEYQDVNHRGLIIFPVLKGNHRVQIFFGETTLRKLSDAISLVSLLILIMIPLVILKLRKK